MSSGSDDQNELTRKIGFLCATASEDCTMVLDVCHQASATEVNAKEAVRALRREFKYGEPAGQLAATRSTSAKILSTLQDLLVSSRTSPVVRERVIDVVAAAAYANRANPDAGICKLWRDVKPSDNPEEGVPIDSENPMFNLPGLMG
ncbi:hypothetical protein B0H19DRAFT_1243914 [Mycena capillaripes]|nr:hypothetical protein B0H19DRAFT_1243914 [Mycena capillaripes]